MTTDTTKSSLQQLQDLIHEKFGIERAELGPGASMRDKGFDSLALVEFLFAVEDHFKISLPDTDDENMNNLGQLAALVDELLAKKAAAGPVPAGVGAPGAAASASAGAAAGAGAGAGAGAAAGPAAEPEAADKSA